MDILYLTLKNPNLNESGIYPDLINALTKAGHKVTIAFADSPKNTPHTEIITEYGVRIMKVTTGEMFGVNFIKKGINTLRLEPKLKNAIRTHLKGEHFDLVLYATPPVTFANVVKYCKKAYGCRSFLMLKDIFPQNAVDIGLFKENSLIHRFFRNKEKKLYELSDVIGCMSQGNVDYLKKHNPQIPDDKVIIFPNTIKVDDIIKVNSSEIKDRKLRLVFGGNLGKPQAIDYLLEVVKYDKSPVYDRVEFLFVGNGSERELVRKTCEGRDNATFIDFMPPDEYNELMESCDVGIVSLDSRFTIPNYPSRMLGYMDMEKPMLACTDRNTDVKELLTEQANCGLWCASDDVEAFWACVEILMDDDIRRMLGVNGRKYLKEHFNVGNSVRILEDTMNK